MSYTRLAVLALAATTLAASGCGGTTKSTVTTAQTSEAQEGPAKAAFIEQADAICASLNRKVAVAPGTTFATQAPPLVAYERTVAALVKLTPPTSIAEDWKQMLADQQTIAADTVKLGEAGKAHNLSATRTVFYTIDNTQKQMLAIARRDGFRDCSHSA